ncbi:pneumococcal serine-rich repeat protein isoform X8 [Bactrocera dorsalis]|uniref:Pneumococcal serine-rich repeat protein isoform X8 n=1 Tax=Bactrocera dorsalis TaxID=27457 RepID=A0ABM3JFB2_BACDO|nr:pneumococcal serine-rich repeat protein isoform X8 [Bactrocera dorsalis]
MEVATTNTHHHNHHHHHQQHQHLGHQLHHPAHRLPMAKAQQQQQQQQQQNSLIVSAASDSATRNGNSGGSPRSPFQREVREWQRIDPDTGALLSGRLEADRWINGPLNSYGKISDSQNISQPNGTQHTQRKQLEVLQKRTANGAVQVIRAQTVQTSSSRSWSSSNSNSASTSASASASASPICMQTNVIGGRSILHNHNNSTNNHTNNNNNNSINNSSKHFHSTLQQHLAEANTHWLQLSPPTIAATVDISEVSTDDDLDKAAATIAETQYIVDDGEIDEDAAGDGNGESVCSGGGGVDVDAAPCNYSISRSGSAGSGSGGSKGHALSSSAASSSSTLHSQSSGLLVPDTAPSLKLSNLMKSSSGGSSSSNNSTKLNTHKSAVGKVSLHAIVGGGAGVGDSNSTRVNNDLTESPKSTATTTKSSSEALSGTKTWQPQQQRSNARHLEQATLYGQNSNSSKTRVGVADCDDCYAVVADADESQPRYHQHHLQTQQQQLRRQQQQQSGGLLSETATPTRRRDLESFRLYGDSTAASTLSASATAGAATADNNAKADDLRLSTRQLRRQQQPFGQLSSSALLQRSHSISTDDLSNEWESNEAVAESNEWRRVSKLRRSFQSSSTANNNVNNSKELSTQESTTSSIRRPYDLPASTVSVSRIRAELESGRRLTTAMRNNHVDLAALESILHGPDRTTDASKRNTLLTAESLKEIRGRLKKLSDESLYKDDFIAYQQPPAADEHIEVQQSVRRKLSIPRLRQLTPEESLEISTPTQQPSSAFKVVGATHKPHDNNETLKNLNQKHTSNSLESRQKATRDTSSTEWHSRRKSYGFEKMSPPDSKTMYRMDASTDSGLGRSGELGNWSPTEAAASTAARATVIHFGEPAKTVTSAHYRAGKSPVRRTPDEDLLKRHSIAVDESQYVRDNLRKTSQVHLNGFYEPAEPAAKTTLQLSRFEHNTAESNQGLNAGSTLFQRTQNAQKRVEFCKTEVHFAAESGRVNIVETDGKPPPTNNFRRRRRTTSGPLQTLTKTASTAATTTTAVSTTAAAATTTASNVTHFGDDHQQRHRTIATSVVAYKASLMEPSTVLNDAQAMSAPTSVTVSVQKLCDSQHAEGSRGSYASTTSGVDTTDNENDEIAAIRGILKNKPVKPKPYHLGENIDSADALWGVQLKPVSGGGSSGVGVREKEDSPTAALNKSVAERVRIVEKRHEHNAPNGYSTKINLSLDEPAAARDWPSADLPKSNIMSIELHSPQTSLDKRDSFKRNQTPPVAKPRTVSNVSANEHPQIHVATTVKQTADRFTTAEQQRESLKIVKEARGARKLREHELSYFGVPHVHKHDDNEPKPKLLSNSNSNTMSMSKRSLPSRQRLTVIGNDDTKSLRRHEAHNTDTTTKNTVSETTEAQTKAQTATKWQLLNDKPDLLRHSPIAVEPQLTRRTADVQQRERNSTSVERNKRMSTKELRLEDELNDLDEADNPDEHFYENITNEITPVFKVKSPQPYDRKMDVERDAYILNEMNENADLTMKALSDEAAHKDRRRRRSSLHRRDSKPLETIEEKMHTQTPNDSFIAVKMSRGTLASEAKRHARNDNNTRVRTSSQSSVESCPRARSRSLSSEREYENIRTPKTTRTPSSAATKTQSKITSKQQHRSSSRESQRSARLPYSSGDEVNPREEQRVRMKSKRSSNSTSGTTGRGSSERRSSNSTKKDAEKHGHHSTTTSSRDVEQRRRAASSTTHASQREERGECVPVPPQQRTTSSGRSSSSKRRDEHATSNTAASGGSSGRHTSSRTATEKSRSSANAGVRLLRSLRVGRTTDDAKVSSTEHRASGHRGTSEREREKAHEKEREKESQSKSRGHSTSKTQHHSSSSEHHHRVADTNTHHLAAHSGSMSSKTREHKKSALTAVEKQHERATTPTHSKSSQVINGRHTGQHDGHRKHNDQRRVLHTRPQQNEATSTTTTTHRKRSEHSARERK